MITELPKDVIFAWRQFSGTEAFQVGIQYLRRNGAPSRVGTDIPSMIEHAAKWCAYHEALDDITEILTSIPKPERSIDEPNLNA